MRKLVRITIGILTLLSAHIMMGGAHKGALVIAGRSYSTTVIASNRTDAAIDLALTDCLVGPLPTLHLPAHGVGVKYRVEGDRCGSGDQSGISLIDLDTDATIDARLLYHDYLGFTTSSFVVPLLEGHLNEYGKYTVVGPVVSDWANGEQAHIAIFNRSAVAATVEYGFLGSTSDTVTARANALTFFQIPTQGQGYLKIGQPALSIGPLPPAADLQGFVVWGHGAGSQWVSPF